MEIETTNRKELENLATVAGRKELKELAAHYEYEEEIPWDCDFLQLAQAIHDKHVKDLSGVNEALLGPRTDK